MFDQWSDGRRQDWPAWAIDSITRADFVIVVASPGYRQAGDGMAPPAGRGAQTEAAVLRELQHRDRTEWTRRMLPVILPGHHLDEIPLFLQPYSASHFVVTEISTAGAAGLLRVLTGQSTRQPPDAG
jgi:hypothetical protein